MAKFLDLEGLNYFWEKIKSWVLERFAYKSDLNQKLDKLRSGQNIKTINNLDILGLGNIEIQSGGAVDSVNGKTGDVVLDAEDVNALPKSTTIPTKVSDLTNDSSFSSVSIDRKVSTGTNIADITIDGTTTLLYAPEGGGSITIDNELSTTSENPVQNKVITQTLNEKADLDDIPDVSNFITNTVNNLTNYYLKSETYTKAEVSALIGAIQNFHYEFYASTSAVTNPQGNVLYLIGPTGTGSDKYEEYVYSNNDWHKIGDTSIDLSGYVTTSALNTALASYATTQDLEDAVDDSKVFWAEVDVTTFAEIQDAIDYGRTVMVKDEDDYVYRLSSFFRDDMIVFSLIESSERYIKAYVVYNDDTWDDVDGGTIELQNNKVNSISSSSDNSHYPSARAVYQALQSYTPTSNLAAVATSGSYNDLSNKPTIPAAQVNSDWNASSGVAQILNKPTIPTVPTISTDIASDKADNTKTTGAKAVYDAIHPAYGSSQPQGGMLPNVLYKLGTLSGSVTIAFATPTDNTIENEYKFTFTADSTAPTITWPQSVTSWIGNSIDNGAPKVDADTYYEVSVLDGCGIFNKF